MVKWVDRVGGHPHLGYVNLSISTHIKSLVDSACIFWFQLLAPHFLLQCRLCAILILLSSGLNALAQVEIWLTDPASSIFFKKQPKVVQFEITKEVSPPAQKESKAPPTIHVDPSQTYQTIDGFGWCLTGGSAEHLMGMSPAARAALLRELYTTEGTNIGSSYLRITIAASDLDRRPFSYNDLPPGQTDPRLEKFSLEPDRSGVIPILREILSLNPNIKIMASPWSAPAWMKDNQDTRGGSLKPEFQESYAQYFVKYIQEMGAEGIPIDAITVQNEPLHPGNNPSMFMPAPQQAAFIKNFLGPALRKAGITTKIIIYDHNCDHPEYPISILDDPESEPFIDGSAFHLYAGKIAALSQVHKAHPDKSLYFTEQWVGGPGNMRKDVPFHIRELIIGATRHWSRTVLEWNLSSSPNYQPHTDRGGCDRCLGAVTLAGDQVTRNPAYYIVAHASKFVRPGSVRLASNEITKLPNVAFKTPSGNYVLIVLNDANSAQAFEIRFGDKKASVSLNSGAAVTCVW